MTPFKPLLAALSRLTTALEQLTPALTQATRELHQAKMTDEADGSVNYPSQDPPENTRTGWGQCERCGRGPS